ncbi:hypothetical protein SESBI_50881, partial [Sesbania bispinosa]
ILTFTHFYTLSYHLQTPHLCGKKWNHGLELTTTKIGAPISNPATSTEQEATRIKYT